MKKHPKNSRGLVAQEFLDYTGESNGRFHSIDSQTASEDSMLLKGKSMNLNSALQQRVDALGVDVILYQLQSMSSKSKIKLKEKLVSELVHVRAALERIEAKEVHAVSALPNPAASLESGFPGVRVAESSPQTHRGFPMKKPVGFNRQLSFASDGRNGFNRGKEKRTPKANQLYSNPNYVGTTDKAPSLEKQKPKASSSAGVKRGSSSSAKVDLPKKQKVVDSRFGPCFDILKVLMNHKFSWVFNEPVDPEKLNIPDYFSIIANPMDLGTIKQKLETERYSSPIEFAADVRLTFENAKTYNPPSNNVHQWAVALSDLFERRWKSAKAKLGGDEMFPKVAQQQHTQVPNVDQDLQVGSSKQLYVQALSANTYQSQPFPEKQFNPSKKHNPSLNHAKKQNGPLNNAKRLSQPQQSVKRIPEQNKVRERDTSSKMQVVNAKPSPQKLQKPEQSHPKEKSTRRPMTGEEKTQLLNDLQAIESEAPSEIIHFLKDHLPPSENEEDIEIDVEALGDDLLFELRELLSNFFIRKQTAAAQIEDAAVTSQPQEIERETKELHIDAGGADDEIVDIEGDGGPLTTNNESENLLGSPRNDTSSNSSSDSGSSSSSSDSDNASANDSDADDMGHNNTVQHVGNSDPETTGAKRLVSTLDEENVHPKASVDGDAHQEGESAPPERQVSPDKQLRAALMRSRFAETILKAREKTLPQVNNGDPEKMRKEREQLEKLQREEKARIEAAAKAAEAVRKQAEAAAAAEAKRKREMEREAQRLRLQKMERTVEIDENNQILKDLERLSYAQPDQVPSSADETSPVGSLEGLGDFQLQPGDNPLQKLGLFIKDEDDEHFMEDEANHMGIDQVDENTFLKTDENAGTNENGAADVVAADVEEGEID